MNGDACSRLEKVHLDQETIDEDELMTKVKEFIKAEINIDKATVSKFDQIVSDTFNMINDTW